MKSFLAIYFSFGLLIAGLAMADNIHRCGGGDMKPGEIAEGVVFWGTAAVAVAAMWWRGQSIPEPTCREHRS